MLVTAEIFGDAFANDACPNSVDNVHLCHIVEQGLVDKGVQLLHGFFITFSSQIQSGSWSACGCSFHHIDLLLLGCSFSDLSRLNSASSKIIWWVPPVLPSDRPWADWQACLSTVANHQNIVLPLWFPCFFGLFQHFYSVTNPPFQEPIFFSWLLASIIPAVWRLDLAWRFLRIVSSRSEPDQWFPALPALPYLAQFLFSRLNHCGVF